MSHLDYRCVHSGLLWWAKALEPVVPWHANSQLSENWLFSGSRALFDGKMNEYYQVKDTD